MQNKRKKICMLTSAHQVFDGRIFHKEARSLAKAGYDVTLIAQHSKNEVVDGIKIVKVPKPHNRFYRVLITDIRILILAFKQKAEIYHFHDPELVFVGLILKVLGKKVIYDVHEDVPEQILSKYYIPHYLRKSIAILVGFIEQLAFKVFNYVITANDSTREKNKKLTNICTVKNFPILNANGGFFRRDVLGELAIPVLVYAGGLSEERGITQVVNAIEFVSGKLEFLLLGEFERELYGDKLKRLKGFKKVNYVGKVRVDEVRKYYYRSDIGIACLQPTKKYRMNVPTKLFEYMEAGLPVIASDFPLWREIIDGSDCGVCVDPTDPDEIREGIKYLIEHPVKAREMGENGRRAVMERYNWDKESKKLFAVYKGLSK
jgi:glycosyltransferase involved in cell wall biosynthesis